MREVEKAFTNLHAQTCRVSAEDGVVKGLRAGPVSAALAAALLVVLAVSGMKLLVPGLRQATKSPPKRAALHVPPVRQARHQLPAARPPSSGLVAVIKTSRSALPRPVWGMAAPTLALPPGSDALGVSLPKRMRWKALGGHGRNGPGAGS